MTNEDDGRVLKDRALASGASSCLQPPAFDPSRITEMLQGIDEKCLAPIVKAAADNFYVQVMDAAHDYLLENLDYNLRAEVRNLQEENRRMRTELYETRKMVGNPYGPHADTLEAIALLDRNSARYLTLLYAVGNKYDGEERHETALRYIKQAEAPRDSDASLAEDPKGLSGEAVAARAVEDGIAQGPSA